MNYEINKFFKNNIPGLLSLFKNTFNLMHYIANSNVSVTKTNFYYFIFNATTEVEVTSSKCTFIRIA